MEEVGEGNRGMESEMRIVFLMAVFFAAFQPVFAAKQSVAVLPSVGDLNASELDFFTNKAQEIAVQVLPKDSFEVFSKEVIIKRLEGYDEYRKKCKEISCIAELGRTAMVDYVARCSFTKLSGLDFTVSFELYNVSTEGLIDKFVDKAKDTDGLLAIMEKRIPDGFRKIPGAAPKAKPAPPPITDGIRGLETADDYEIDVSRYFLANINTEPQGAALSFDGIPNEKCPKTPCKVELAEGEIRIIAVLEQYERADTTVSIKEKKQNVSIRLKPNFGILEIKPAYSEGIGKNENWSLTINSKAAFSSWENRLSPGKYSVKLSHRCYEDISFEVGINKSSREVFDMASHANLKKGGLVLSAEKDGEPVSEPVFVNGQRVGETPFSGYVAVCSEIEIGKAKEKVNVRLEHKQTIRYKHEAQIYGTFMDERDFKEYKTVKIGTQIWMAENLNYYVNGSKCYDNKPENCIKDGRLYDWNVAMGVCPSGWHLPSNAEWDVLMAAVDGEEVAEKKLNFALPGGYGNPDGSFSYADYGGWWSASEDNRDSAYYRNMFYNFGNAYWRNRFKFYLFSVRCVQGPPIYKPPTYKQSTNNQSTYELPPFYEQLTNNKLTYEPPTYEQPSNKSFWLALALDIAGMAFVYYGYEMDKEMVNRYEYYTSLGSSTTKAEFDDAQTKVEDAKTKRNVSYILGSIFLATGIGVHIWF